MIDDTFVKAFLEEGPEQPGPAPEVEAKPMYTRAEVDQIVQDTINSTIAAMSGNTPAGNVPGEPEEELSEGGNENGSSEEGNSGENE